MPKLNNDLQDFKLPGSYGFSATKLTDLGATEYTICTVALDQSGSTESFRPEMIKAVKEIINACRYSPRADNLMIRLVTFSNSLTEVHGFKLLSNCNLDDYDNMFTDAGMTALFDAAVNSIDATAAYGKTLVESEFSTNGIVFVITDGADNKSSHGISAVADSLKKATSNESLESLVSILICVNVTDTSISAALS